MRVHELCRPLDETVIRILEAVCAVTSELGLDCFVVGATARDILLTHVFNIPPGRATRDVDFAIAVESWDQFAAIKQALEKAAGFISSSKMMQRLDFNDGTMKISYPVDLIPFGGVEQTAGKLFWPPDMAVIMNVIGYREVLETSIRVAITEEMTVRVASLPGLALLKMFSWQDRGVKNSKDAQDLYLLLRTYCNAGNTDRIYGEEFDLLTSCNHEPELAGAELLGKDIAQITDQATIDAVMLLFDNEEKLLELATHMNRGKNFDELSKSDGIALVDRMKNGFKQGIRR